LRNRRPRVKLSSEVIGPWSGSVIKHNGHYRTLAAGALAREPIRGAGDNVR
jgi:hypothetical protein